MIHNKGEDITHINIALSNKERIVTSFIVDACQNVFPYLLGQVSSKAHATEIISNIQSWIYEG